MNSIKSILAAKDGVSLLLLSQINFNAGLGMMSKLREDERTRNDKSADALRNDTTQADEFEQYLPTTKKAAPLDVSANLVAASLVLAYDISGDNIEFLKSGIKSPAAIIRSQMDWQANKEAQARMVTAHKFGLTVTADKFIDQIKGHQQDKIASFITEAQSATAAGIKGQEARHLIHIIEETYSNPEWRAKLADSAISLYESAVKRIEAGKFADLPDEIITFAQEALTQRAA